MTRQLEAAAEQRERARRLALVKALEYELFDVIEHLGGYLVGFALNYDEFQSLITIKADFEGRRKVAFVRSDSMMNSIILACRMARNNKLKWKMDRWPAKKT